MEQKIVIKVYMLCDKCRSKALQLVAGAYGVGSVAIEGDDRDKLAVVGVGVDPVNLTKCLRKKIGNAEIVTVEMVTKPEPEKTETQCPEQWYPGYYYSQPAMAYPYPHGYCYSYTL